MGGGAEMFGPWLWLWRGAQVSSTWTVEASIFALRAKESDAHSVFDTDAVRTTQPMDTWHAATDR